MIVFSRVSYIYSHTTILGMLEKQLIMRYNRFSFYEVSQELLIMSYFKYKINTNNEVDTVVEAHYSPKEDLGSDYAKDTS